MNDILKQRLVGALVILVAAAFFWPIVFVGPEGETLDRSSQVPGIPSLQKMQLDAPEPLEGIAPAVVPESHAPDPTVAELEQQSASATRAQEDVEEQPEGLDEEGIPIAWTLQVVTVSKQDKAEELMQQLLDMGYKAYFKAVTHGDGRLYRVYVGPKFERDKMQEAKLVIDKKFRVNSIVARYLP